MSAVREVGGFKWYVPDETFRNLPLEDWERAHRDWAIKNIPKGGMFIDIGANTGSYTVTLAGHFDRVLAIEPADANIKVLKTNLALNDIRNATIIERAAWDECKEISFHQCLENDFSSAAVASEESNPFGLSPIKTSGVRAVTVDSLAVHSVRLVKIDVEGGEVHVLLGMLDTIRRWRPVLFVEVHEEPMLTFVKTLMEILKYELENPDQFKRLAVLRFVPKEGMKRWEEH